jgi:hypothetical protein
MAGIFWPWNVNNNCDKCNACACGCACNSCGCNNNCGCDDPKNVAVITAIRAVIAKGDGCFDNAGNW